MLRDSHLHSWRKHCTPSFLRTPPLPSQHLVLFISLFQRSICCIMRIYNSHLFDMRLQAGKTSLVRALMSPSCKCSLIDLDDRTVGIDRYEMQLYNCVASSFGTASSFAQPSPPSIHTSSMTQPLQDGAGSYKFPDGSFYQGEWRDLRPYGTGCMQYCDGSAYEGRFVAGMRHGKGILKFSSSLSHRHNKLACFFRSQHARCETL